MTPEAWLTILGSGLLAAIIPAAIGAYQQRQQRRAAAPREDAETDEVIVSRVTRENERLSTRLEAQDVKIAAQDAKIDTLIGEIKKMRVEHDEFRSNVESLLGEHSIPIPAWWRAK